MGERFNAQTGRGVDLEIIHLFYANDAMVFYEAEVAEIRHLIAIPTIFEVISGLPCKLVEKLRLLN